MVTCGLHRPSPASPYWLQTVRPRVGPQFSCVGMAVIWGHLRGSVVKNLPANAGEADSIPGLRRSLGEGNGNPLVWEIPWTEKPGGLQSMGLQRVGHNLATKQQQSIVTWGKLLLCTHMSIISEKIREKMKGPCGALESMVENLFLMKVKDIPTYVICKSSGSVLSPACCAHVPTCPSSLPAQLPS